MGAQSRSEVAEAVREQTKELSLKSGDSKHSCLSLDQLATHFPSRF